MSVIGNDIIDLRVAARESNWQRPGFLEKVFTSNERLCIESSGSPFRTVWKMWSMKEAAYKSYVRLTGKSFFNPKRLVTTINSDDKGTVSVEGLSFETSTSLNNAFIHTVSRLTSKNHNAEQGQVTLEQSRIPSSQAFKNCKYLASILHINSEKQSVDIRSALKRELAAYVNLTERDLTVRKGKNGVPEVETSTHKLPVDISISHHGVFGAYTISFRNNTIEKFLS